MLYYEGLSCPVCKKPFAENEDIVACPQCGLPHHRSCWMTVGHCYLAEKHGTEEQWSRNKAETETAPQRESAVDTTANICPHCHTRNIEFAEFCTHCGAALSPTEWHSQESPVNEFRPFRSVHQESEIFTDDEQLGDATAREMMAFVGKNQSYYIARFRRITEGKGGGWNWCAFLFGPFWLLYRKQRLTGILLFIVQTVYDLFYGYWMLPFTTATTESQRVAAMETIMHDSLALPIFLLSLILTIVHVILGLKGNELYKSACENKIRRIKEEAPNVSMAELTACGGVSVVSVILFYFISNLLSSVFTVLLSAALYMFL
ncbi:MAG: DUF2628 domain-containing protein [Clostridia bacterium]|nr:DUF2628 domain-containing protein [Clostridia bacterium]